MSESPGAIVILAHRQGALLAPTVRSALAAIHGRDAIALIVALHDADQATAMVAAAEVGEAGRLRRFDGVSRGAALNGALDDATGAWAVVLTPGDLISRDWLAAAIAAIDVDRKAVVRPEYLLVYGEMAGANEFLLRQAGFESPTFIRKRLMFERVLFGPLALAREAYLGMPFEGDLEDHALGLDDWHWMRKAVMAGVAKPVAAASTICATLHRGGPDPTTHEADLALCPAGPFW